MYEIYKGSGTLSTPYTQNVAQTLVTAGSQNTRSAGTTVHNGSLGSLKSALSFVCA